MSRSPDAKTGERLESWKEIAAYLKRDVRTLYRWEKEGLPVHRVFHLKRGTVYAYTKELDTWLGQRSSMLEMSEPRQAWSRRIFLLAGALATVVIAGSLLLRRHDRPLEGQDGRKVVLAVLPLENLSSGPEQDYFSEGLTEEMITELGRLDPRHIAVIARNSSMRYKGTSKSARQIGQDLSADYLLEGKVLQAGSRLRITVQLIDAKSQIYLWTQSYAREPRDVLSFHDEVARDVAREISIRLAPKKETSLARARTINPEAHEAYLKGLYFWNKLTEEDISKSIGYFRQAIEKDPNYALAYVGLAKGYNILGNMAAIPPRDAYPRMKEAAERALQLDNTLGEANAVLGWCRLLYDWDFPAAKQEFQRAIELNPNYANAHQGYAAYFVSMGRPEDALTEIREAEKLDPLSSSIQIDVGWIQLAARRPYDAITRFDDILEADPDFSMVHLFLAWAYDQKNMWDRSLAEGQKVTALMEPSRSLMLARAYAGVRDRRRSLEMLAKSKAESRRRYLSPYHTALVYAALGDKDQAFAWLERGYQDRFWRMAFLKSDSRLDSLRSDPRFANLLDRIGLPR